MAYYSIMDMITWSPERRRFYEMYGYDMGPQVSSPMDAMRPQVQQPNILSTQLDPSSHMGIGVDQSIGYLPNRQSAGEAWQDQMRFRTYSPSGDLTAPPTPPKVKQVITETEPGDPTPTKSVTTIDYSDIKPEPLNPRIGMGPEGLYPNDYSRQQLSNRATSRLQNFGKYGVDPVVTEATVGQDFGGNLPYSTEVAREGIIPERGYTYEQRVVDGPESPEMGIAPYTSFTPPVEEDLNQTMHAIMMAESGGDPNAHNPGTNAVPEDSLGLFQINWNFWGDKKANQWGVKPYDIINNATKHILGRDLRREDLFNPDVNTAAAYAIQAREGFEPWSVYTSGKYKEKLPGLEGIYHTGRRGIDKVGRVGAGILDDATNIGQGVLDRAGKFAGQAVDFGQGLIEQIPYGQQTQSTPEDIYKMQGIDISPSKEEQFMDETGLFGKGRFIPPMSRDPQDPPRIDVGATPLASPENVYEMQGIDTSIDTTRPVTLSFPSGGTAAFWRGHGTAPEVAERDDPYQFMEEGGAGRESVLNQISRGVQEGIQDTTGAVRDFFLGERGTIDDPSQDAWHLGPGLARAGRDVAGSVKDVISGEEIPNWVPFDDYFRDNPWTTRPIQENIDRLLETTGEKEAREYGERALLASDYQKGLLARTGEENAQVIADVANAQSGESTDTDDKVVNDKDTLPFLGNDGTSNVTTNADAQREVNKIWAKFPQDIDSREERYLHALKEMYKKAAILNVIANLTGQESMAPKFMELAADRFEKLEGFEGERRLANIAKVVFFREDGSLAIPPSKQAAFERAMKAGASLSEAQVISGYMDDEEKEKPKEWEPIQLQKTIGSLLNIPVSTPIAQSRALIAQAIATAKANGNELEVQRLQNLSDEIEAFISKAKVGVPPKQDSPSQKIDQLWTMYKASEVFTSTWEGFRKWLLDPQGKEIIDAIVGEDETLESILQNPDAQNVINAKIHYLTITKEDMEK